MTHQEVADAIKVLDSWRSEIFEEENARRLVEVERVRGECGKIGHIFGASPWNMLMERDHRVCIICGAPEERARGEST